MKLSEELESRGFIHQFVGESLGVITDKEHRVIYHGIDPSADSAHAGNFVIWMLLKHLSLHGHKIVFLVGGATGMIGDPKPDAERQLKPLEEVESNVQKIKAQAEKFFAGSEITFVNNYDWFKDFPVLDFLREVGKHYTVNELIKKDAIATRLQSDTGLSYTEFAYPLIQGYDYLRLFEDKNCTVQIGGSDQWGNIVSGVDLVRRKKQTEVHAITVPLIVDKATGKKFGKSEGNAVWLDPEKTSPYQFYQFWLNVSDESVIDYLKLFTFLTLEDISAIERETLANPGDRAGQRILAFEVTANVHGKEQAEAAAQVTNLLFGNGELTQLEEVEKETLLANAPTKDVVIGQSVVDILVETELATSKREARTFIESGAISLNGVKLADLETDIIESNFIAGIALLRRGKKQVVVLKI